MADIFISYSSRDREKAEQLTELLSSAGLSVWIDNAAIDAATSLSKEIVSAINGCKVFVVLLSPASLESHNVIKEVSLASEKRKKILPLDLEPVTLTEDFEYQLAGIQRAPMSNIDAIIRALAKLGLEATTGSTTAPLSTSGKDQRRSLIILPFEDLSPDQDNQWFADGLAGELIDALGKIKSLRILDRKTSLDLRGVKQSTVELSKLFHNRYFVQGTVRKFGDQIKISVSLLDIETGDHLWQESYKGVMQDIFDLQESVAAKVVDGLRLHLTNEERSQLQERGTMSAEAFELMARAYDYFGRHTHESLLAAIALTDAAIMKDPSYLEAYRLKGQLLTNVYRSYNRDPAVLEQAEAVIRQARQARPDTDELQLVEVRVRLYQKRTAEAEALAKEYVRQRPNDWRSHFTMGFFYSLIHQFEKAVEPYLQALRLHPDDISISMNLTDTCMQAGRTELAEQIAREYLPIWDRHLILHPDDQAAPVDRTLMLLWAGRPDDARAAGLPLIDATSDGFCLFRLAVMFGLLHDEPAALRAVKRALVAGFKDPQIVEFLDNEHEGVASLRGSAEHDEVMRMVEQIEVEQKRANTNG